MRDWIWRGAIVAAVLGTGILQLVTPFHFTYWHDLLPRLYYLPIVAAALQFGWRGGLATALLAAAAFVPYIIVSDRADRHLYESVEIVSFISVAILTGVLADRERRQKAELRATAEQLAAVYDKLQTNFEGLKRAERLSAIGQLWPVWRMRFAIHWPVSRALPPYCSEAAHQMPDMAGVSA